MESMRACLHSLSERADLSRYITDIAADDLAEILTWLKYDQVTLTGGSYGTRAAQVFMRRHPERVRAAVLDGVVPMDAHSPVTYSATATDALNRLVEACSEEGECAQAFPGLKAETESIWQRMDQGPVTLMVQDPRDSTSVEVEVPKLVMGYAVRGILYSPALFVDLPMMLHEASQGNFGPLVSAHVRRMMGFSNRAFATGMYFSVFCSEDVPFISDREVKESEGILDDGMVTNYRQVCEGWPRASVSAEWMDPVTSEIPVLLLSGEFDPVTTSGMGEAVSRGFPNGLHVVVRGAGHGSGGNPLGVPCTSRIIDDFIRAGSVQGLDVSCVEDIQRPPFGVERPTR